MKRILNFIFVFSFASLLFSSGIDYEDKPEKIAKIFLKANVYKNGIGVEKNLDKAYELYRKIAWPSANDLRKEAFEHLEKAANDGITAAEYQLAIFYSQPSGQYTDLEKAKKLLKKAREKKYIYLILDEACELTFNSNKDKEKLKKGFGILKEVADSNNPLAEYYFAKACLIFNEIGFIKPHQKDAIKYLEKSYNHAPEIAGNDLATSYFFGITVPEDRAKAVAIWEHTYFSLIKANNWDKQRIVVLKLMICYYYGLGTPCDKEKAFALLPTSVYYKKVCENKSPKEVAEYFENIVKDSGVVYLKKMCL